MNTLRTLTIGAALATALAAFAQAPAANPGDWMMKMDQHMTAMRGLHDRMAGARSVDERNALMTEQMKLMQGGMNMMGGMGPGAMGSGGMGPGAMGAGGMGPGAMGAGGMGPGAMGKGAMPGAETAAPDMALRQQMLEKRMEMMQSMMQMMIDRMPPTTPAKK